MDTLLSEPPLFLKESALSQLPFFSESRVDGYDLPPRPPNVCGDCWEGVFAMHLGLSCVSPRDVQRHRGWSKEIQYSTSGVELASREENCIWCKFVLHEGWSTRPHDLEWTIRVRGAVHKYIPDDSDERHCYQGVTVNINGEERYKGYVYAAPDDPAASYIKTRGTLRDVGSTRAMTLARQHIKECAEGHEHCKSLAPPKPLLPTRLVDCSDPANPKLVSTTGKRGEYLALSYVWGGDQPYKTKKSTVLIYERGIDSCILPLTVRDAISVTHALGFQFLWVDTLCIIHDDKEDQTRELGRMHRVYRDAHVTIFAASAESATEGFLLERPLRWSTDHILPFICPPPSTSLELQDGRSATQLQLGQVHLDSIYSARKSFGEDLGVMSTRAWCMQEYLMSPRILVFAPTRLLFRCRTKTIQGVGHSFCSTTGDLRLPDTLFLRDPPAAEPGSKEWVDMRKAWAKVVGDYSRRKTSYESDKLVACSAVARQFSRVLKSDYLAGLWRSGALLTDLLWLTHRIAPEELGCRRPTAYRAPSWSWASVGRGVFNLNEHHSEDLVRLGPKTIALAEVVKCWVKLKDPLFPFGEVESGTLVVRGTAIPCYRGRGTLYLEKSKWVVRPPPFDSEQAGQQWGSELGGSNSDAEDPVDRVELLTRANIADVWLDDDADELPERFWLVPFVRDVTEYAGDIGMDCGIVVKRSSLAGSEHDPTPKFQRIGYFHWSRKMQPEDPLWDLDPITRAIQDRDSPSRPWMDIVIV